MLPEVALDAYTGGMNTIIKTIVLVCLFAIPSAAQDTEKAMGGSSAKEMQDTKPTEEMQEAEQATETEDQKLEKELFAFLDEHFPGMKAELNGIREKEGKAAYDAVFDQQVEILDHYKLMMRSGKDIAMLVIEQNQMHKELQVLLDRYEELDPDDPARVQARANAEPLLAKSNTFSGVWAERQAAMLKKRGADRYAKQIAAMEKKAKKMEALRAQPKKVFDDWIAYREKSIKAAEGTKKKLPPNWHTNPKVAMAAAKESGKLVHVFCSTTWCGPCQKMVKNVFPKEEVQEALKDYEALYLDGDVFGVFCRKYHVRTFPTSIFINAEGDFLHRSDANGMTTEEFLEWLKVAK